MHFTGKLRGREIGYNIRSCTLSLMCQNVTKYGDSLALLFL